MNDVKWMKVQLECNCVSAGMIYIIERNMVLL